MNVELFSNKTDFKPVCIPCPEKEICGAYVGDLLSWVMGRANPGNVWITIMSNVNVLAVATLADLSCIILAEGEMLDESTLSEARKRGINVFSTELSAYEAAIRVADVIS